MAIAPLIIIGAGIAGLWTALHAQKRHVIVICRSTLGAETSTGWAQGGVAAALSEEDSCDRHAADTIKAGAGLVNQKAAHILANMGPTNVKQLAHLGVPFERDETGWALSREAAHSCARVARIKGDQAGAGILAALIHAARQAPHIEILENHTLKALLPDTDGGCSGVLVSTPSAELISIDAPDTVLATGSIGGLYAMTTTPRSSQGDGLAMAAQLGASIRDPEFVQFHPTAINIAQDPAPLATEALRGEGATLIDANGQRFMKSQHEDGELAPRDVVARAVHRQIKTGKGAFLDAQACTGKAFPDLFPAVFKACQRAGIDPRFEPIPIAPAAHYHMGGIATDFDGRTNVNGLWAIGECASTGVHGANRLASNSLLDGLVFGKRAADRLNTAPQRKIKTLAPDQIRTLPEPVHLRLRQLMSAYAGVERDEQGLITLLDFIDEQDARFGKTHAMIAARFITIAALKRQESRGAHFRQDWPLAHAIAKTSLLTLSDLDCDRPIECDAAGQAQ